MNQVTDAKLRPLFQPDASRPPRALLVAGACGNVGFGKLGQFGRLLRQYGVPVIALDLSPAVHEVKERLRAAFGKRFDPQEVTDIVDNIHVVQGTLKDVPAELALGFVFEAIPERLDIKRAFYTSVRERDPEAFVFSATSGFPSTTLFTGIAGAERCGVMHPFFPHLTNKLWEVPVEGAVTGKNEMQAFRGFLSRLGMNMIPVRDVPAFAADRLFCGMMLEAVRIHADTGLGPAQIDDVCRKVLGTSPFYVHNMIPGANYLSAHCMELLQHEVDSNLYEIPAAWRPYIEDPTKQWPYEKGSRCPPESVGMVRDRMLGMLFALTAYMVEHRVARTDAINFLCENALAFRQGTPALVENMGFQGAREVVQRFLAEQEITQPEQVAPVAAFADDKPGWHEVYVETNVHDGIGLLSLKRTTINDTFIAELDRAYQRLQEDPAVRAMVIAPDGQYSREFGHGADLAAFVPVLGEKDQALALIQRWKATLSKLRRGKPTVAALVGRVLGGGLELAASCHARIAGHGTKLAFPETTVGVIPGLGGCHHVHRFSRPEAHARINEVLLTGQMFGVDEAAQWGFVGEIVAIAELPVRSMALAATLAATPDRLPAFREGPAAIEVDRSVSATNEAGVPLDANLRDLLARTIQDTNALPWAEASALEEERAAESLAMSSSAIGVAAMMRGKPPQFENPLG